MNPIKELFKLSSFNNLLTSTGYNQPYYIDRKGIAYYIDKKNRKYY